MTSSFKTQPARYPQGLVRPSAQLDALAARGRTDKTMWITPFIETMECKTKHTAKNRIEKGGSSML